MRSAGTHDVAAVTDATIRARTRRVMMRYATISEGKLLVIVVVVVLAPGAKGGVGAGMGGWG